MANAVVDDEKRPLNGGNKTATWIRYVIYLSMFAEGYDAGVFSGVGVLVEEHWNLSGEQLGSLYGCFYIGMATGMFSGGWLADRLGRVPAMCVTNAVLTISAFVMAFAPDFTVLFIGRVGIGLGVGSGWTVGLLYMAETSPASLRGRDGAGLDLFLNCGIMAGYMCNYLLLGITDDWRVMLGIGGILPAIAGAAISFGILPESPRFLLLKGDKAGARVRLHQLLDDDEAEATFATWGQPTQLEGLSGLFRDSTRIRMTIAGIGVALAQMLCGVAIIINVMSLMVKNAGHSIEVAFGVTFFVCFLKTATVAFALLFVVEQYGRRPLLLVSAAGVTISCFVTAYAFEKELGVAAIQTGLCAYMVLFSVGLGACAMPYVGEVFETPVRATGCSLGLGLGRIFNAFMLWNLPSFMAESSYNIALVFYFFGGLTFMATIFIAAFCPETKQKKLEDMRDVFAKPMWARD